MYSDAKRIHLLEKLRQETDEAKLAAVERILSPKPNALPPAKKPDWQRLSGILTKEEGDELDRIIEEGCGRVNPEDWKSPFEDV